MGQDDEEAAGMVQKVKQGGAHSRAPSSSHSYGTLEPPLHMLLPSSSSTTSRPPPKSPTAAGDYSSSYYVCTPPPPRAGARGGGAGPPPPPLALQLVVVALLFFIAAATLAAGLLAADQSSSAVTTTRRVSVVAMVACLVQACPLVLLLLTTTTNDTPTKLSARKQAADAREKEEARLRRGAALPVGEVAKDLRTDLHAGLTREEAARRLAEVRRRSGSSSSRSKQQPGGGPFLSFSSSSPPWSGAVPTWVLLGRALYSELWQRWSNPLLLWAMALLVAMQPPQPTTAPSPSSATSSGAGAPEAAVSSPCPYEWLVLVLVLATLALQTLRRWRTLRCLWQVQCGDGVSRLGPVRVVRGGEVVEVNHGRLVQGDVVLLRPGQEVPADIRLVQTWGGLELRAQQQPQQRQPLQVEEEGRGHSIGASSSSSMVPEGVPGPGVWARLLVVPPNDGGGVTSPPPRRSPPGSKNAASPPPSSSLLLSRRTVIAPAGALVRRGRARGLVVALPPPRQHHPSQPPPLPAAAKATPSQESLRWLAHVGLALALGVPALCLLLSYPPHGATPGGEEQGAGGVAGTAAAMLAVVWALLPGGGGGGVGAVGDEEEGEEVIATGLQSFGGVHLGQGYRGRALEAVEGLARADTLLLDKAGTITEGRPRLREVVVVGGPSEQDSKEEEDDEEGQEGEGGGGVASPACQHQQGVLVRRLSADGQKLSSELRGAAHSSSGLDQLVEAWLHTCSFADNSNNAPWSSFSPCSDSSTSHGGEEGGKDLSSSWLSSSSSVDLEREWDGLGPFDRAVLRSLLGVPEDHHTSPPPHASFSSPPKSVATRTTASGSIIYMAAPATLHDDDHQHASDDQDDDDAALLLQLTSSPLASALTRPSSSSSSAPPCLFLRSPLTSSSSPRLLPPPLAAMLVAKLRQAPYRLVSEVPWSSNLRFQARTYEQLPPLTGTTVAAGGGGVEETKENVGRGPGGSSSSRRGGRRTYFRGSPESLLARCAMAPHQQRANTPVSSPVPGDDGHFHPKAGKGGAVNTTTTTTPALRRLLPLRTALLAAVEELTRKGYSVQGLALKDDEEEQQDQKQPLPATSTSSPAMMAMIGGGGAVTTAAATSRSAMDGATVVGLLAFEDRCKASSARAVANMVDRQGVAVVMVTGETSSEAALHLATRAGLLQGTSGSTRGGYAAGEPPLVVVRRGGGQQHQVGLGVVSCSPSSPWSQDEELLRGMRVLCKATPQDRVAAVCALQEKLGRRVAVVGNGLGDVAAMQQPGAVALVLGHKGTVCTDAARQAAAIVIEDGEPEVLSEVLVECRRLLHLVAHVARFDLGCRLGIAAVCLLLAPSHGLFALPPAWLLVLGLARSLTTLGIMVPRGHSDHDDDDDEGDEDDRQHQHHHHDGHPPSAEEERRRSSFSSRSASTSDAEARVMLSPPGPQASSSRTSSHHHQQHGSSSSSFDRAAMLWQSLLLSLPLVLTAVPLPLLIHQHLCRHVAAASASSSSSSCPPLSPLLASSLLLTLPLLPLFLLRKPLGLLLLQPRHWYSYRQHPMHYCLHHPPSPALVLLLLLALPCFLLLRLLGPSSSPSSPHLLPLPALLLLLVCPSLPLLLLLAVRRSGLWAWPPTCRTAAASSSSSSLSSGGLPFRPPPLLTTPLSHPTASSAGAPYHHHHHLQQQQQQQQCPLPPGTTPPFLIVHNSTPRQQQQYQHHPRSATNPFVFFNAPSPTTRP